MTKDDMQALDRNALIQLTADAMSVLAEGSQPRGTEAARKLSEDERKWWKGAFDSARP